MLSIQLPFLILATLFRLRYGPAGVGLPMTSLERTPDKTPFLSLALPPLLPLPLSSSNISPAPQQHAGETLYQTAIQLSVEYSAAVLVEKLQALIYG